MKDVFKIGHHVLWPKKWVECQVVNNVNAAIVGELRQVPLVQVVCSRPGGGRWWGVLLVKFLELKSNAVCFVSLCVCVCFSVCFLGCF